MIVASLTVGMVLAARGRGIGRLIKGLAEGDPVSWVIVVGAVVVIGGWYGYKHYQGKKQSGDSQRDGD